MGESKEKWAPTQFSQGDPCSQQNYTNHRNYRNFRNYSSQEYCKTSRATTLRASTNIGTRPRVSKDAALHAATFFCCRFGHL